VLQRRNSTIPPAIFELVNKNAYGEIHDNNLSWHFEKHRIASTSNAADGYTSVCTTVHMCRTMDRG